MGAQATLVIDFGAAGADAVLEAELDSGLNFGKSSFNAGDVVFFRVYSDVSYEIEVTSGIVSEEGSNPHTEAVEGEVFQFIKEKSVNTSKVVKAGEAITPTWYGPVLGSLSKTGTKQITVDSVSQTPFGVCSADYVTEYDLWRLTPPGGMPETYSIIVLIKAT